MAKTEMIRAWIEPELKRGAEAIFKVLGLSLTKAITLFYRQTAAWLAFFSRDPEC